MKNIIVTSGGTEEYIDDVRVLTNISTGKLGVEIACALGNINNVHIHYIHSRNAVKPQCFGKIITCTEVRTANDALETIKKIMTENQIDAVVHAMAVSDFTFKKDKSVKLKSNDAEGFIDYMRSTITKNPKIISYIKKWNPKTILVGFKFEVGTSVDELIKLSKKSIKDNDCDLIIANDKIEMQKVGKHIAHFVYADQIKDNSEQPEVTVIGKDNIAYLISSFLKIKLNIKDDI